MRRAEDNARHETSLASHVTALTPGHPAGAAALVAAVAVARCKRSHSRMGNARARQRMWMVTPFLRSNTELGV